MTGQIITETSAKVDPSREPELLERYQQLIEGELPDGLVRTELLRGEAGQWRIQTLWRDQEAIAAMRAGPEPPAAPALFRSLGGEPSLVILEVEASSVART